MKIISKLSNGNKILTTGYSLVMLIMCYYLNKKKKNQTKLKLTTEAETYPTTTYTECGNAALTKFLRYNNCVYTKNNIRL